MDKIHAVFCNLTLFQNSIYIFYSSLTVYSVTAIRRSHVTDIKCYKIMTSKIMVVWVMVGEIT